MATTDASDGGSGTKCARDFVEERLRNADSSMSPSELADEYGCTNGHIRNLLSDLRGEGVVQRIAHGQYEAAPDDGEGETADLSEDLLAESEGNAEAETDGEAPQERAEETGEAVDGEARSVDPATEATETVSVEEDERADVDTSEMDQSDEYRQQFEDETETVDGDESDEIGTEPVEEIEDDTGDGGIPPGMAILAGTVVLVVLLFVVSRRDGDESDEDQEEQQDDESGPVDPTEAWT